MIKRDKCHYVFQKKTKITVLVHLRSNVVHVLKKVDETVFLISAVLK